MARIAGLGAGLASEHLGLLTEAVQLYLSNRAVRPAVVVQLEASINDNAELGHLLAR